jgi:tetratricopeptide (TPR) repeat protein
MSVSIIQINLSDAECNLGRWNHALQRLESLDSLCRPKGIARAGLATQRAWIAAHQDRPEDAIALLDAADVLDLPEEYRAEFHFTRGAAHLAAGNFPAAEAAFAEAAKVIRRPSSERNLLFLRARLASARRDWISAERLCREGAEHPYKGQGADGLLLWSKALRELGRDPEEALKLMRERDPESYLCAS